MDELNPTGKSIHQIRLAKEIAELDEKAWHLANGVPQISELVKAQYQQYLLIHRISQLEGAIKGALPYFNGLAHFAEQHDEDVTKVRQVIANLKQLIESKDQ